MRRLDTPGRAMVAMVITSVAAILSMATARTVLATPTPNGASIETRTFNDCPSSTVTTSNNYPASIQITDAMDPLCTGFANLHSWSFSGDGGATAVVFNNNSNFRFSADFRIDGPGEGEGGLRISPWYGKFVDGRIMANATTGEIACFGGALPFYSFTVNHGITYTRGTTIHLEATYRARGLCSTDPASIQYRVVYNDNTYDSPVLPFGPQNLEECVHGVWGMLNDGRVGGYFSPRANTGASLAATWSNVTFLRLDPVGTPQTVAATIETRTFNDCPSSTVTTSNNYPASIQITDVMDPLCAGFINLHSWSFSEDGGVTAAAFNNSSDFQFAADFRIDGPGEGEGGLRISPWYGKFVDGRIEANATTGEIACFGGALPFYNFTVSHGITYTRGTTIHLAARYEANELVSTDPATIQYRVVYNGISYDSPVLQFGEQNRLECVHGLWGMLSDGRVGGYFQPRANTGASLTATWGNIMYTACPEDPPQSVYYRDADGDTYGNPAISVVACQLPNGFAANGTDCDDANPAVNPGVAELCNDIDDDCDGAVDEGFTACMAAKALGLTGTVDGSAAWGDYDGDGDLDLVVSGYDPSSAAVTRLYRNEGGANPTFTSVATSLPNLVIGSARWGDYDRDGDLDLLVTGSMLSSTVSQIYRNGGGPTPTFTNIGAALTPVSDHSAGEWGDYDGDGDLDILLTGRDPSAVKVSKLYRNNGGVNPTFTEVVGALPVAVTDGAIAWGDYDNDGDLDLLLTGTYFGIGTTRIARLYRNSGGANPTFVEAPVGLSGVTSSTAAWGDYDNDGDLDLLITGTGISAPTATVYRNSGGTDPTFADIGAGLAGVTGGSAAWGDYDNDGYLDLVIAGSAAPRLAKVYRNQGGTNPTFVDAGVSLTAVQWPSAAWGDYDNDGDLDLLLAGTTTTGAAGAITTLYRNNSAVPVNTPPTPPSNLHVQLLGGTTVRFSWDAGSDAQTPAGGLGYNLRIGTSPGGHQVSPAMANSANGYRRIPALGNANERLSSVVTVPAVSTYYWSVQAVDGAWAGSPFAAEQAFNMTVDVEGGGELPAQFALAPGLPNPFSHSTSLSFDLPRAERVRLEVFDLSGRRVRSLVAREVPAGRHHETWDGTDERGGRVAAGVYLYHLRAGSFAATRRVVLLP